MEQLALTVAEACAAARIGRTTLVHAYFEVNRDILWTTVTEAVPPLAEHLKALLKDE
jgi:uncharacterized protein with HEPN domain